MKLTKLTGKKRSMFGTALYTIAIIIKAFGIAMTYFLLSGDEWFMYYTGMSYDMDYQGIGSMYFGSMWMALQVGLLVYSLTHDKYAVGKPGHRSWGKALVFAWMPVQALFIWFGDYGYGGGLWMMSWEYVAVVVIDALILAGLLSKSGSSIANNLRPFKDKSAKKLQHEEDRERRAMGLPPKHRKHHHHHDSSSSSDSDSDSSDSESDVEVGRRVLCDRCRGALSQGGDRPNREPERQKAPAGKPKIRVDGLSEED